MTSFQTLIALPLFAMVVLTFAVLFTLGAKRYKAAKTREFDLSYYKLYQGDGEPSHIRKLARNLENLFETPVIFYLAIILTIALRLESSILLILAWTYVFLRYIHSYIHCTSNKVVWRFRVYVISCLILLTYWIMLFFKIL